MICSTVGDELTLAHGATRDITADVERNQEIESLGGGQPAGEKRLGARPVAAVKHPRKIRISPDARLRQFVENGNPFVGLADDRVDGRLEAKLGPLRHLVDDDVLNDVPRRPQRQDHDQYEKRRQSSLQRHFEPPSPCVVVSTPSRRHFKARPPS
jgi:hypothetical protein